MTRSAWSLWLAGISITVTASSPFGPERPLPRAGTVEPSYTAPVFSLPIAAPAPADGNVRGEDCGTCRQLGECLAGQHKFDAGDGPDRAYSEGTHGCGPDYCSVAHPESGTCIIEGPELARVWQVGVDGTSEDVNAVIAALDGKVRYNAARRSLQVEGCDGGIVLSVPLE